MDISAEEHTSAAAPSQKSGINLMCCAIRCIDYGMVEFLSEKGMDISTVSCRYVEEGVLPLPPLFCGLRDLLNLNAEENEIVDERNKTVYESEVLKNLKQLVKDFAGNFTVTTQVSADSQATETSRVITVLDFIISSSGNKYSTGFKLELMRFFLYIFNFKLYIPLTDKLLKVDFLVPSKAVEDRLFYLFQAGASPEFIRYFQKQSTSMFSGLGMPFPHCHYNTSLCRSLVLQCDTDFQNIDFEEMDTGVDPYVQTKLFDSMSAANPKAAIMENTIGQFVIPNKKNMVHVPPAAENSMKEFLEWYQGVTSSPFTLQNECRTLIRNSLVEASDHRNILNRIELLNLPEKLRKYLMYE